jgi:hypothetical protein
MLKIINKVLIFIVFLSVFSHPIQGQGTNGTRLNSPYTRYGLGETYSLMMPNSQGSAGAFAATLSSDALSFDINLQNPASFSKLKITSFEIGGYYQRANLTENTNNIYTKSISNDGGLSYLSLSFPINRTWVASRDTSKKKIKIQWGMGFALVPHSQVGYDVAITRNLENIGDLQYNYVGKGNRFRLNWANGWSYKNFSAGLNLGYLMGTVTNRSTVSFLDSSYIYAYNEDVVRVQTTRGILWDGGLMYEKRLKRTPKNQNSAYSSGTKFPFLLKIGAYGTSNSQAKTLNNQFYRRYGQYYAYDTVVNNAETKGTMQLPAHIGGGVSFGVENWWAVGFNYEQTFWSQYLNSAKPETMKNAYRIALGFQIRPRPIGNNFQTSTFRMGVFYSTDGRIIENMNKIVQLQKYGINFGMNLRLIGKAKTAMNETFVTSVAASNISFEYGVLNAPDLINQRYFQVNLSFNLNENNWFIRSRYR